MKRIVSALLVLCSFYIPSLAMATPKAAEYYSSLKSPFTEIINSYISEPFVFEHGYRGIFPDEKAFF